MSDMALVLAISIPVGLFFGAVSYCITSRLGGKR